MSDATGDGLVADIGLTVAYHTTPIHYLPAIARCRRLSSKRELLAIGYDTGHFRSTSHSVDVTRGFESFVHLSARPLPPILRSKLKSGFPHAELRVVIGHLPARDLHLCRFNIARNRNRSFQQGPEHGWLRDGLRVPVARGADECRGLLQASSDGDLEVLFPGGVDLSSDTEVRAFDDADAALAEAALAAAGTGWRVTLHAGPAYPRRADRASAAEEEYARFLADVSYRGSGLDFDRFKDQPTLLG
ncbi:hypothetical protein [Azospirillum brasilense]|uniref:hypothetical protein n=1 Tax=Azospirillum brasilense TaxID=192 RepID=UPI000E69AA6D|nr:hypothetical protein [Azospirillum brasilense]NUB25307.1 hypothetical protein [Azospirillum brasilense]NUB33625.1 hypothetical protein [Azospirillum brasilense]RIW01507.1 hypothetical protein D2T81_18075 [Azospirillum brasilense]